MPIIAALLLATATATAPPYASKTPLPAPALFAPGAISTGDYESHPAFTPDGATLFYLKDSPTFSYWTMVFSKFENGQWQPPQLAPWSGQYRDADPFITPDGKRLYFISDRPIDEKNVDKTKRKDLDIWMVDRDGDGWSAPKRLDEPVNSAGNEWFPTIAADGTIYFGSDRPGGIGATDLYRCRLVEGKYQPAENLGPNINSTADEYEPLINADQTVLIFMAGGRTDEKGGGDLYVSTAVNGQWQPARNLPIPINTPFMEIGPKISPDGKWLFFTSTRTLFRGGPLPEKKSTDEMLSTLRGPRNGLGDIYQVDISVVTPTP